MDHLTKSLIYFCLVVCETAPWLSYVGTDDQPMHVTVERSYVGECDWLWQVWCWLYKSVVTVVHIWIILRAHPGFTLLCKASAASVTISTWKNYWTPTCSTHFHQFTLGMLGKECVRMHVSRSSHVWTYLKYIQCSTWLNVKCISLTPLLEWRIT